MDEECGDHLCADALCQPAACPDGFCNGEETICTCEDDCGGCDGCCNGTECKTGDTANHCGNDGEKCHECGEGADCVCWTCSGGSSGTWTDPTSCLTWQNPPAENTKSWASASSYCAYLSLGGSTNWHLPTVGELRSLIRGCPATEPDGSCNVHEDDCLKMSCRHASCNGCTNAGGPANCLWPEEVQGVCTVPHWSSSDVPDLTDDRWYVFFFTGSVYGTDKDDAKFVRCVR